MSAKVKASTKMHEVIRTGGTYAQVVCVGSRTACNRYWVALSPSEREYHKVQVAQ